MNNKILPKKADIALIAAIIITASLFLLFRQNTEKKTLEVVCDGKTVYTETLSQSTTEHKYILENGITLMISAQGVCISESDCKGLDCVKTGMLTRPGDRAACVPNKTVIKLNNTKSTLTDAITY